MKTCLIGLSGSIVNSSKNVQNVETAPPIPPTKKDAMLAIVMMDSASSIGDTTKVNPTSSAEEEAVIETCLMDSTESAIGASHVKPLFEAPPNNSTEEEQHGTTKCGNVATEVMGILL